MSYIGNQPTTVAFLTDQFSGTGSQTAFTLSAAPANTASIIVAVSGVLQDPTTYSVSGLTLTFSAAPPAGTGNISVRFLGIPASGIVNTAYRTQTEFTATSGQTTFSVPSYTVGFIDVYRNGALLGSADFTATNGTTVVLTAGASAGDLVETISFSVSSVLNAIPAVSGAVNSAYLSPNLSLVTPSVTTTLGVGGATAAASGAGITFPATQSASSDANTLDDYEEGTWTPTLFGSGGSAGSQAYTLQAGRYVKIGRYVFLSGYLQINNKGSWTNDVSIGGFPFTVNNENASYSATTFYNSQMVLPASSFGAGCYPVPGSVTARMFSQTNSGSTNLGDYANEITNNTQIGAFTICYYASA